MKPGLLFYWLCADLRPALSPPSLKEGGAAEHEAECTPAGFVSLNPINPKPFPASSQFSPRPQPRSSNPKLIYYSFQRDGMYSRAALKDGLKPLTLKANPAPPGPSILNRNLGLNNFILCDTPSV